LEAFTRLDAPALPVTQPNCDTDQIIPARFLRKLRAEGLGEFLFHDLRFRPDGTEDPAFLLNQDPYRSARIVVAARNFGCGSSRENAVWALEDYGFRAAIAPSFGDIFASNCLHNGILTIRLPHEVVSDALRALVDAPGTRIAIDLETQIVVLPATGPYRFETDPFVRHCLLNGLDELGYTMSHAAKIDDFERRRLDDERSGSPTYSGMLK
jgi:3-isopropylmalate/(R)-2-methylmalate dehydratase small subunit